VAASSTDAGDAGTPASIDEAAEPTAETDVTSAPMESAAATATGADAVPAEVADDAAISETQSEDPGCHSFTGSTGVLMANGSTLPIDQLKAGDEIANSVPGKSGTQPNKITKVIKTHTDHDFVDVTIEPLKTADGTSGKTTKGISRIGKAVAAGLTALAVATGGTLTTTFTHPFYDITQASFVEADHFHAGDVLQTPAGEAEITSLHLYYASTVTYDLDIGALHTYYVAAGSTPVLVHNCGNETLASQAMNAAIDLQQLRYTATNESGDQGYWGTTAVMGVYSPETGKVETRTGINGDGPAPDSWPEWAKKAFVQASGDAEAGIISKLADGESLEYGGTSRNVCWRCYSQASGANMRFGSTGSRGGPQASPFRLFWREPGYPDNPNVTVYPENPY
jgi:hypothetical protein